MGGGSQKSSSKTTETALSKQQADILRIRERQYQQFFAPRLFSLMASAAQGGMGKMFAEPGVGKVNQAYQSTLSDFQRQAARRGMAGSGFESAGLAALAASRANAVSDAARAGEQQALGTQMQLFQIAQGLAPTPTTAAPMGNNSSSSGWNVQLSG